MKDLSHTEYVRLMGELVNQFVALSERRWVTREKELLEQIKSLEAHLKGEVEGD